MSQLFKDIVSTESMAKARLQSKQRKGKTARAKKLYGGAKTISKINASYRYSNPTLVQPSNAKTCTFWRGCVLSVPMYQQLGFTLTPNSSPCLAFAFDLQGVRGWLGGNFAYSVPVSNSTDFQSLFDVYKINAVKMKLFFSHNFSNVNTPATCLPIVAIVNDFDDATEVLNKNTVLEKAGVRMMQFDAHNSNGFTHYVKPSCRNVVSQIDSGTGTESVSSAGVSFGGQWLDCANNNIVHSGVKLVYNNQERQNTTDIGTMTIYFEIEYMFKGYR